MGKFPRSKHDDLVDAATMALQFLRDSSLIGLPVKEKVENRERAGHRPHRQPKLYPC